MMKYLYRRKLLLLLLPILLLGCAAVKEGHPYLKLVDKTATASAPWVIDDVVSEGGTEFGGAYRKFLGITRDGSYLVQDFYTMGSKMSDPYKVKDEDAVRATVDIGFSIKESNPLSLQNSTYKAYTPEGNIFIEYGIFDGKPHGPFGMWLYNAHKVYEGEFKEGEMVGTWKEWNKAGNLVKETIREWDEERGLFKGNSKTWDDEGKLIEKATFMWDEETNVIERVTQE